MLKTSVLAAAFGLGLATLAHATIVPVTVVPVPAQPGASAFQTVGEGCGPGRWRGPQGGCNPFGGPGGINRGTAFECPYGYHLVPGRPDRCVPNR